jgi:hypothetical protein
MNDTPSSATLAPEITTNVLQQTASKLGVKVPANVEEDFTMLLKNTRDAILKVVEMEGTKSDVLCYVR